MKTPRTGHQPPNRLLLLGALLALLPMLAAVDIPAKTGPFRSPGSPRTDLLNPKPIPAGLRSVGWLNGVGGVAFGAVAQPVPSSVQLKGITYLASAPDGQRLRVTVNSGGADEQVVAPLPDWQLIPIARFAAGDQHAVFTLFGEAATAAETDQLLADGYDILNYHPAFNDTLLGLRLFHADVLILGEASADLPRMDSGYLLGAGESAPNVSANRGALIALEPFVFDASGQQIFRSYVITDHERPVTFGVTNGQLTLTGDPLWYLWKYSVPDAQLQSRYNSAAVVANQKLDQEEARDRLLLTPQEFDAKYTPTYTQARFDELFDEVISADVLQALPSASAALSQQIKAIGGVNPAVYSSLAATMRYAAFFRAVRQAAPQSFHNFVQAVDCTRPQPNLVTPGAYALGDEMILPAETIPGPTSCPDWRIPGATGGGPDASAGASDAAPEADAGSGTPDSSVAGADAPGAVIDAPIAGIDAGSPVADAGVAADAVSSGDTNSPSSDLGQSGGAGPFDGPGQLADASGSNMGSIGGNTGAGASAAGADASATGITGGSLDASTSGAAGRSSGCSCALTARHQPVHPALWLAVICLAARWCRRRRREGGMK